MKYLVRLNPKAFNPVTRKVIAGRLWEIEQTATKDSERVIWHCGDVRIDETPIRDLYRLSKDGEPPWEQTYFGICTRGYDDAIIIKTGAHDVSGN